MAALIRSGWCFLPVNLLLHRGAAVPRLGAVHHDVCWLGEVIAVGHLRQLLRLATIDFPVAAVVALETPDWKCVTVDYMWTGGHGIPEYVIVLTMRMVVSASLSMACDVSLSTSTR